jgi:hypothetical protein
LVRVFTAAYASAVDFLSAFDGEVSRGGLLVRGADAAGALAMSACTLAVQVADRAPVEVPARVAAVVPGIGVAVVLEGVPASLKDLAAALRGEALEDAPTEGAAPGESEEVEPRLLGERLKAMNVTQKMQVALSRSREERLALLRDINKTLHVYVLRNPRIGLDEVQHAAKQSTLGPDALKLISENREWGSNPTVCLALVRNPRTPLSIALKLLDKVPMADLRAIAKGGARDQLVQAARKKVTGG